MKLEVKNDVRIVGRLVEKNIVTDVDKEGNEIIRGYIVVKTSDDGEHRCDVYSKKVTKTGAISKLYQAYETVMNEHIAHKITEYQDKNLVTLEENELEQCNIVSVQGEFSVRDYLSTKDNEMHYLNPIRARFISRVEERVIETTPQVATFEVGGIISAITEEMSGGKPTGNKWVELNHIAQTITTENNIKRFEPRILFPVKLKLNKELVAGFEGAGCVKGMYANLRGKMFNTVEVNEVSTDVAFGEQNVKAFNNIVRYNLITSGDAVQSLEMIGLTNDLATQLISQRKLAVEEARQKNATSGDMTQSNISTTASANVPMDNPFV